MFRYNVAGYKGAQRLFGPLPTDAPNADVAKLYVTAWLRRQPEGASIVNACDHLYAVREPKKEKAK